MLVIIIKFIRDQWFGSLLLVLFLIYTLYGQFSETALLRKENQIESKISILNKTKEVSVKKIDSLSQNDTIVMTKIVLIKQKENEKIKAIDVLPISGLQKFFSDRYSE